MKLTSPPPHRQRILLAVLAVALGMGVSRYRQNAAIRHVLAGVPTTYVAPATFPPLGPARRLEPGILFHEVTLARGPLTSKLWIYLPEHPTTATLPCIFIAPAGTRLYHGMALSAGDRPEHLPYVRAGFAVVAYELDGALPGQHPTNDEVYVAAQSFKSAAAGLERV